MSDVRIPDVSDYQGTVNWTQVIASGRAGGICKATEGNNFTAKTFVGNWVTLKALNARRGAYHFARPDQSSGAAQASRFLSVVQSWQPGDLLILDLEAGGGNLSAWALDWLRTVEKLSGLTPWLYSYGPFIRQHLGDPALARYPLWLAAYQTSPPPCPPPWTSYQLWQHTNSAQIPGIAGPCDESVGTLPDLTSPSPTPVQPVVGAVHDFEEATIKQTMMHIGPLDSDGCGWADWQPGLGRDPNPVALVLLGPSPPDDRGYWPQQSKVILAAQPRGGALRVTVRNGTPGDTVTCFATVS